MTQYKQTKRRFSPEFKLEAIEQVVKYQQRAVEVARALELDPSLLRKWVRQYEAETRGITPTGGALTPTGGALTPTGGALTPEQRRIQALEKQVRRLEMEKERLKQAAVLMSEISVKCVR